MPGLVFGRRRLLLGGDELMVPYATSACGRTVWVLLLMVGLALESHMLLTGQCPDAGYLVLSYETLSIVVGALSLLVEFRIAKASTLGTIIDPGPRNELLGMYLSQKAVLGAIQLVLGLCGAALAVFIPIVAPCEASIAVIMSGLGLTSISQFIDAGGMYCCYLALTTTDSIWINDDGEEVLVEEHGMLSEMERRYEDFCRTACKWAAWCSCTFNVFGGNQEADLAHVSRVFSRMLSARRYVDIVATDIAAGLILLRHVQKAEDYKRRDELRGDIGSPSPSPVTTDPGLQQLPVGETAVGKAPKADTGESGLVDRVGREESHGGGAGVPSPGSVPLHERPQKHRKYYKVSRDEKVLDISRGGEDWQVLQETAYFVRYANVMYSVWGTLAVDPWSGMRRVIRRSPSWCPRFLTNRGARNRKSLFRAAFSRRGIGSRDVDATGLSSLGDGNARVGEDRALDPSFYASGLREAEIRGDNFWGSHETALRAELPYGAELVLAHFNNCLDETPYCVAVDHTWQTIVITIRGTHSFEDFLVDAMAEPRSLESVGAEWGFDGSEMHAHEGILRRAEWIRRDLEDSGVLRLLLGDDATSDSWGLGSAGGGGGRSSIDATIQEARPRSYGGPAGSRGRRLSARMPLASAVEGSGFCAGYTVRAVGHSLGAGCAALLTLLLKKAYPSVRGIAVSPPGGLVSEGACREATEALVTSLVLNDDVVPRMSAQSIEALADQVLDVLGRSRVNKLFVMRSLLRPDEDAHRPELYLEPGQTSWTNNDPAPDSRDHPVISMANLHSDDAEAGISRGVSQESSEGGEGALRYHRQLRRYREHLRQEGGSRSHFHRLRPPGRILHLVNTDYAVERVQVYACEDGCLATCCFCVPASPRREEDVGACCCTPGSGRQRKRIFTPVWASPNDLAEIKITPAFLVDHSPDEILKATEQMFQDLGVCV